MIKKTINLALAFIVMGCGLSVKPLPTPTNFSEYESRATQIAIRAAPTSTLLVPTPETFELNSQVIFRDDFEQRLRSGWAWVNERADMWSLSAQFGFLQISALNGYFRLANASNVLLMAAPQNNFAIETSLKFDPQDSEQFAGLIALDSNQNFVQAGLGYCSPVVGCLGRGIYIDIYENGNLSLPRHMIAYDYDNLFIRLKFENGKITIHTSQDKLSWFRTFETELPFNVSQVGIIAAQNNYANVIPSIALFDYFEISLIGQ